ncbi:MAG: xanthine dehydrogenase family protein molybdopterin-binding subunit, partial [Halobacteria archaeon]|nr:xanthine dehydrogenase family protein molybdopterin-binding subunit [Halobacteria archaeon]
MPGLKLSRREFLKISGALGGGLLMGIQLGGCEEKPATTTAPATVPPTPTTTDFNPNVWLTIAPDDSISIRVASSEMGQGVMTSLPMLIAEELDADWSKVQAEFAPVNPAFANPLFGRQQTGGSTAIRGYWGLLREAGAVAREMLLTAAAQTWGVTTQECETNNGHVIQIATGDRLSYGELATLAATLPVPDAAFLKEPEEFKLLGKSQPRLDGPAKVDGSAEFGFDIQLPGLLTAMVVRCPVYGGKLKQFDATQAKAIDGVREVIAIKTGVAVVADHYWAAKLGRDALHIEWNYGPDAELSSAAITQRFAEVVDDGTIGRDDGNVNKAIKSASKSIEAVYEVPYLAHACMEPMNCTAHVRKDGCDVWVPTQGQTRTHNTAMQLTGLPAEKVRVHTTFLGGGFGRRSEQDFVTDAIETSKAMGAPVKVVWTREDDIQHDYYRPATYNRLTAALDDQGMPSAWRHRIAGPSISARDAKDREDSVSDWSAT